MKWIGTILILLLIAGCGTDEPTSPAPTTGTIKGTLSLKPGISGNLDNTSVKLFTDTSFQNFVKETKASGTTDATFAFSGLNPGTYYLRFWKDLNGDAQEDWSDFIGYAGKPSDPLVPLPLVVTAGQTLDVTLTVDYFGGGRLFYGNTWAERWTVNWPNDLLTIHYTSILSGTLDSLVFITPDPDLYGIFYPGQILIAGQPDSSDIQITDPTKFFPAGQYIFGFGGRASWGRLIDIPFIEADTVNVN